MLVISLSGRELCTKNLYQKERLSTLNSLRGVMDWLLKRLQCIRLDKAQSGNWFLLHNNAPSHIATIVKQFLTKKGITVLPTPLIHQIWYLRLISIP